MQPAGITFFQDKQMLGSRYDSAAQSGSKAGEGAHQLFEIA